MTTVNHALLLAVHNMLKMNSFSAQYSMGLPGLPDELDNLYGRFTQLNSIEEYNAVINELYKEQQITPETTAHVFEILPGILSRYSPDGWLAKVDMIRNNEIWGWVKRVDSEKPQFITLEVNGQVLFESFIADSVRPDLKKAGFDNGWYGYRVYLDILYRKPNPVFVAVSDPDSDNILAYKAFWL